MQFVARVRSIWSWLPSFRAVAETEHLPTAASELAVVPSSLSRTVKLLEDELGVVLFDRAAKTLALNETGRRLLAATRDAMRIVDEAVAAATGNEMRGPATAVASSAIAHVVLPRACAALAERHPDLRPSMIVDDDANADVLLLRGDADVALVLEPPRSPDLVVTEVATWTRGVYARAGRGDDGGPLRCVEVDSDGWPPDVERRVGARACDQRAALEIAARSALVTIAFDAVARHGEVFARLARLSAPHVEPRRLYLVHRRALGVHRRTEALAEAIRWVLGQIASAGEVDGAGNRR